MIDSNVVVAADAAGAGALVATVEESPGVGTGIDSAERARERTRRGDQRHNMDSK